MTDEKQSGELSRLYVSPVSDCPKAAIDSITNDTWNVLKNQDIMSARTTWLISLPAWIKISLISWDVLECLKS